MSAGLDLREGAIFADQFRVVRPLARGGMGAVYVVEQLATRRERALKLMHPTLVSDERSLERFGREAQVSARIESDHVVEVIAAGVDRASGTPWLCMELLRGEDLAARLARGPLAPAETREIVRQLGHALGAAHRAGIVHRDLKPENLFLAVSRREGVRIAHLIAPSVVLHDAASSWNAIRACRGAQSRRRCLLCRRLVDEGRTLSGFRARDGWGGGVVAAYLDELGGRESQELHFALEAWRDFEPTRDLALLLVGRVGTALLLSDLGSRPDVIAQFGIGTRVSVDPRLAIFLDLRGELRVRPAALAATEASLELSTYGGALVTMGLAIDID